MGTSKQIRQVDAPSLKLESARGTIDLAGGGLRRRTLALLAGLIFGVAALSAHGQVLITTTTSLTSSSPNPSTFGTYVTFTGTVTAPAVTYVPPTPTGSISLTVDGIVVDGSVLLGSDGSFSFSTNGLTPGTHSIVATYPVTPYDMYDNFASSTSQSYSQTVIPAYGPPAIGTTSSILFVPGTLGLVSGLNGLGYGGDGGLANSGTVQLNYPSGVAYDTNGNLFVADSENYVVREIVKSSGNIVTFAGTDQSEGFNTNGGTALGAQLGVLSGLIIDSSNNIYVSDETNGVVWKITSAGGISIFAGGGSFPGDCNGGTDTIGDGCLATDATLSYPTGLAFDAYDNLYIADSHNDLVREVSFSTGTISAFAGNVGDSYDGGCPAALYTTSTGPWTPTLAHLCFPYGIGFDSNGNFYVAESQRYLVRVVTQSTGDISTFAGGGTGTCTGATDADGDGCPATDAILSYPNGLYVDPANRVYIADQLGDVIRMVDTSGTISIVLGGNGSLVKNSIGEPDTVQVLVNGSPVGSANGIDFFTMDPNGDIIATDADSGAVTSAGSSGGYLFPETPIYTTDTTTAANTFSSSFPPYILISNPSGVSLTLNASPVVTGPFGIVTGTGAGTCTFPGTVTPGSSCTLVASFTPTVGNNAVNTGTISISTNVANSPNIIYLSGLGSGTPTPGATLTPGTVPNFTSMAMVTSAPQDVTLTNTGTAPLIIGSTDFDGYNPTDFGDAGTTCPTSPATLDVGASCYYQITFTPTAATTYSAGFQVDVEYYNTAGVLVNYGFLSTNLSGNGIQNTLTAALTPNPVAFGGVVPGQTSPPMIVTLTNSSNGALAGITPTITGTNPSDFTITTGTNACGATLAASASCFIYVTFTPASAASFSATLSVADDASNTPQTATLTGTGLNFVSNVGTALPSQQVAVNFATAGYLTSIQVVTQGQAGTDFTETSGGTCATNNPYSAGQSCTVNVIFDPQAPGARLGAVLLTNDGNAALGTTYLPGTGIGPEIVFGPGLQSTLPSPGYTFLSGDTVDAGRNLYVVDGGGSEVVKVPWNGTSYGTPIPLPFTGLSYPTAVAVDGVGNVFVTDSYRILELPWSGSSYGTQIVLNAGELYGVAGIVVDGNGNLFFSETGYGVLVEMAWTGTGYGPPTTIAAATGLSSPTGLAADANLNIYIADSNNNRVVEIPWNGTSFGTQIVVPTSNLNYPAAVAVDGAGDVYVISAFTTQVVEEPWNGTAFGTQIVVPFTFGPNDELYGIAVDSYGNLFATDADAGAVFELNVSTPPSLTFATTNAGSVSSDSPKTVAVSNIGNASLTFTSGTNPNYPADFPANSSDTNLCSSAAPLTQGGVCDVSVDFMPATVGLLSEDVVLTDNDLNGSGVTQSIMVSGTGVISPQAITFMQPTSPVGYSGTSVNVLLSATGGTSGNPVIFSIDSSSTATGSISGSTLTITSIGNLVIDANQAGNASYLAAPQVQQTVVVNQAAATPVISPAGGTYNAPVAVQITDSSTSPAIYYTTNGSPPSVDSSTYQGLFTVTQSGTEVQAIATATGDVASNAATPATYTVQPYLSFSSAAVGISSDSAQTLTATVSLAGTTAPTAALHYGYDYSLGSVSCSPNGGIEVCTVPVTFIPTLPGARKDALFLMSGTTQLASVLLGGIGQAPLSLVQPGVVTNPVFYNPNYLYGSTVDENGTAYVLGDNSNTVLSVTKAGVTTQLPITGLSSPSGIAVDGAGVLYIAQNTYSKNLVTYNTVTGVQGTLCVAPPAGGASCTADVNNDYLISVAVDQLGNVFATDIEYSPVSVVELTPAGNYTTTAISPSITQPYELTVDSSDNIFVGGYQINEIPSVGTQSQVNTTGASEGLAVDAAGTLYATRYATGTYDVAELPASSYGTPLAGLDGGTSGEIVSPLGLSLGSDGTLIVGDYTSLDRVDRTQGAIAFGEQFVNVASTAQVVGIYNGGNQNLTLSSLAISGAGFAMAPAATNGCTASLVITPGQLCNVDVTATFPQAGTFSGTVTFITNSLNTTSTTQTVNLSGYVYGPYVTANPSLAFGNQNTGTQTSMTVTLNNSGDLYSAVLGISTATVPTGYSISAGTGAGSCGNAKDALVPGASCTITVTFDPASSGAYNGAVSIPVASSGGGGPWPAATFSVSGTGIAAVPMAVLSPGTVTFTGQVLGTTSAPTVVTLSNPGAATLQTINFSIIGTNPSDFAFTTGANACPMTGTTAPVSLAAGATCNVYVTFTPASAAAFSATLSVADSASNSPQTIPLIGTGIQFVSNVGTALPAQQVAVNFATSGYLTSIQVLTQGQSGLDFTETSGGTCTTTIPYSAGQSCTVNVIFDPQAPGARRGAVVLTNGNNAVLGTTYLPGLGMGPELTFGPGVQSTAPAPTSGYSFPFGDTVDAGRNLYVTDSASNQVIKVPWTGTSYGTPVTLPFTGLNAPEGVTVDGGGNIFIDDNSSSRRILELPWNGASYGTQIVLDSGLNNVAGIVVDGDGNLFFSDAGNNVLIEMAWTGSGYGPPTTITAAAGLHSPNGLAVDANRNIYIADSSNNRVVEIPWNGTSFGTEIVLPASNLLYPVAVAVDATGDVYILNSYVGSASIPQVVEEPWNGTAFGTQIVVPFNISTSDELYGLAIDSNGDLFVADYSGSTVFELNVSTPPSLSFASTNVGSVSSDSPKTVAVSNIGNASLTFTSGTNPNYPADFPAYSSDTNLCSSAAPLTQGGSCDVSVDFMPLTAGPLSEDVVLTDNDLNGSGVTQSIMVSGTGVILFTPQAITFTQPTSPVTWSPGLQITLSATGGASGNPVVFTIDSSSSGTGTISGSMLTVSGVGTFVIDANQAGNPSYSPATQVQRTLVVNQATPSITWTAPAAITYGAALSGTQLDATSPVAGAFTYAPAPGAILTAGTHTLTATFTPTDRTDYTTASTNVSLVVNQATPILAWPLPAAIAYGIPLSSAQLNATVTGVNGVVLPGTFTYTPTSGTVLAPGPQTLTVSFVPSDAVNYTGVSGSVRFAVSSVSLSSITPGSATLGAGNTTITLTGAGFVATSVAQVNGIAIPTTLVSPTTLTAVIPAANFAQVATLQITVFDPTISLSTTALPLTITAPPISVALSGPSTVPSGSDTSPTFTVINPYPVDLSITLTLGFTPSVTPPVDDPAIQFSNGTTTFTFVVPANSTAVPPIQVQVGTVAGTIVITPDMKAGGVDVTPSTLQPVLIDVPGAVPSITSSSITRNGDELTVVMNGFSNTREVKQATFQFLAAPGTQIDTPDITLQVGPIFSDWFSSTPSDQYGSTFTYTQIFNVNGSAANIGSIQITLTNTVGVSESFTTQ